jgi:hypothetical protein
LSWLLIIIRKYSELILFSEIFFFFLEKHFLNVTKKTQKYFIICWLYQIWFLNCLLLYILFCVIFFNFIPWNLIFISTWVFVLLIAICFFFFLIKVFYLLDPVHNLLILFIIFEVIYGIIIFFNYLLIFLFVKFGFYYFNYCLILWDNFIKLDLFSISSPFNFLIC